MNTKQNSCLATAIVALLLVGCLPSQATDAPVPNAPLPEGSVELEIVSTNAFIDTYGSYTLVGEVINNGTGPATQVELALTLSDENGSTLLRDLEENPLPYITLKPMLETLAPGQSAPFSYTYDTVNSVPHAFSVVINGFQLGILQRPEMDTEAVQIIDNGSGWFFLSGNLVNRSDQWVRINGLAGGVLDAEGKLLSADWSGTFTSQLAPSGDVSDRDRTPFLVTFADPGQEVSLWRVYWDASVEGNPLDYAIQPSITNSYFDQYGSYHLVGWVTNNSNQPLTVMLVTGVTSEDGTVVDASANTLPVPITPGESMPFNISSFSNINFITEQAARVRNHEIMIDLSYTYPPYYQSVALEPDQEQITKDVSAWLCTGSFTNTTNRPLRDATAVVSVLDLQGNLVASDYNYVLIEEPLAPGGTSSYEVFIYLDPLVDASGYTTLTTIYAALSE